ncbi:alcohol dehydrogenase catalytic domain-containing protein [Actinomadura rugatobispora]|uniref:Alcohol dehydrogenase catalytic domain-containing protein n=1 Tax=Actinomadura rugatobispora TaxID=1994 RepID=A0ABW1ABM7_9ACTN|nr:zinc-binding dehydrogenase [Actinomadura rugatobispora]
MRAVRFHDYGPPATLTLDQVPDPEPGPGEALIEVVAAGVNFSDLQLRSGALRAWAPDLPLPFTAGHEVAGTVTAVGPGADPALLGRRVLALSPTGGGYAELFVSPAEALVPAPDLDEHKALAVLTQGTTAVGILDRAALAPGETVLVTAATGGVGSLLVQLAAHAGATVAAVVDDGQKAETALELGARVAVTPDTLEDAGPVHAVLDSLGGPFTRAALGLLQPVTGRLVMYGRITDRPHEIGSETVYLRALSILGFASALLPPERLVPLRDRAFALAAEGVLDPIVGSVRPLAEAAAAHEAIESRTSVGKHILVP